MSKNASGANKGIDDEVPLFRKATELEEDALGARRVEVVGTRTTELVIASIRSTGVQSDNRLILDEDEARYVRDELTDLLEGGASE